MLDAAFPNTIGIYWGGAPAGAARPYAVMYPDIGMESTADRALSDDVPNDLRFQITSVGDSAEQALLVADKANRALLTSLLTVPGRRVRPIRQEAAQPVRRDDESSALWLATAQYLVRSDPT
ncbi:DUF3168 domain-containing protein [Nonomuraea sp. PA05]|uniref:DUF3168 domain-containing protein n=1 Tax=Nonomuraea sp. PA05 TaxID=2604466 RepID=UPI0011D9D7AF|nr:DUF3168 domain-containing protein [Nonomuraea sp. PA05]TYB69739.1 DUF3168 domain-containing protein [Nonomuraea sp. PA05]